MSRMLKGTLNSNGTFLYFTYMKGRKEERKKGGRRKTEPEGEREGEEEI